MVKSAQTDQFKDGNHNFPIHYDDSLLRVYTNPSNEVFVEDVRTGVTMRLNSRRDIGIEFTTEGRVEPVRVSCMIGWAPLRHANPPALAPRQLPRATAFLFALSKQP